MNKKIIAGAILGIASGAAFAQSSVTIYGVVDAGLTATKGVAAADGSKKSRVGLDSGLLSGSRIGFKGVEDLGGGTSAIFNIENGFNVDNGTQGQGALFGRRAVVGLTNASFGTIELGRQSSVLDNTMGAFTADGNSTAIGAGNLIKYDNRINNSITYTTANYAGFSAKGNYGFGEKTGSASAGRFYGLSLNYANGAFAAGLAGAHSDYTNKTTSGTTVTNNNTTSDVIGSKVFANAAKRDIYLLGASYDFGVVKPFALLSYGDTTFVDASKAKDKGASIGVAVPFGASTVLATATYINVKPNGQQSGNAQQYALGYTYDFSKRTTFYATYDYVKNSNELKNANVAFTTANNGNQLLGVGIRHKF